MFLVDKKLVIYNIYLVIEFIILLRINIIIANLGCREEELLIYQRAINDAHILIPALSLHYRLFITAF